MTVKNVAFDVLICIFSQVYWFGDMNYRVNNLSLEQVKKYISMKDYKEILKNDQLQLEHSLKHVLQVKPDFADSLQVDTLKECKENSVFAGGKRAEAFVQSAEVTFGFW